MTSIFVLLVKGELSQFGRNWLGLFWTFFFPLLLLATLMGMLMSISLTVAQGFAVLALLSVGAAAFLALGLVIAGLSRSTASANILCNRVYFPLIFSGNLMTPVSLPDRVRTVLLANRSTEVVLIF